MKHPWTRALWTVLLSTLAADLAGAAQETTAPAPAAASRPADSDDASRILYFADGRALRARARLTDAGWEVLEGKDQWRTLPATAVVRTALERDVLAEVRRLERELAAGPRAEQASRRVGFADWLLRNGLTNEALAQLDRVLAADPDQVQALSLMARLAPQVGVAAIDSALASEQPTLGVLRAAANATPTVREIAIQRLAFGGPTEELRSDLRAQLSSHSPRLRTLAALALRRIYPGKALPVDDVKELINRSVLDGSDDVRAEAARALRDVRDPDVALPALRALNSSNARVRENSIQALGTMGYRNSVEPLMTYLTKVNTAMQAGRPSGQAGSYIFVGTQTAYIQDFDVEVAQFQAIADPQINTLTEGSVLDGRVLGCYVMSFATEARLVRSSLSDLTGADPGNTNRAWMSWWDENREAWAKPAPPRPETTPSK